MQIQKTLIKENDATRALGVDQKASLTLEFSSDADMTVVVQVRAIGGEWVTKGSYTETSSYNINATGLEWRAICTVYTSGSTLVTLAR